MKFLIKLSGVTSAVASPTGSALVSGVAGAYLLGVPYLDDNSIIKSVAGLHVTVGNAAKQSGTGKASISGQVMSQTALLEGSPDQYSPLFIQEISRIQRHHQVRISCYFFTLF